MVIFASPNTLAHSAKVKVMVVDHAGAFVEFREEAEQKRPTGLAEGQIPQIIEDHQERQVQEVLQLQQRMNTTMDAYGERVAARV